MVKTSAQTAFGQGVDTTRIAALGLSCRVSKRFS